MLTPSGDEEISPLSSSKRKLVNALKQDEHVQKTIATAEMTKKLSVFFVGNTLQAAMSNITLCDEFHNNVSVKDNAK